MSVTAVFVKDKHHPLYGELAGIVGPKFCSDSEFVRTAYSRDTSPALPIVQGIVVRPGDQQQVIDIVKLANYTRTPIVPSGGRASLYGVPPGLPGKAIVLDMTRVKNMVSIDEADMVVTAEAGMTVAELNTRLWKMGWDIHTAMQPWYTDTIGGIISGVPGGGAGRDMSGVGWNTHYICGLKVVLPDGNVLQTGGGPGTNVRLKTTYAREVGGPDMTGMFIGDAGVFGIKLEATYRLFRTPEFRGGVFAYFDTWDEAWRCALKMSETDPPPCAMLGVMEPIPTLKKMGVDKPFILCSVKAYNQEEMEFKLNSIREHVVKMKGRVSEDESTQILLQGAIDGKQYREMGAYGTLGVWTYLELVASPTEAPECLRAVKAIKQSTMERNNIPFEWNLGVATVGGNQWIISSAIFLKGWDHKAMAVMRDLWKKGLEMGAERGWYPDANQGYASIVMGKYWSPQMVGFMRNVKRALDPNNIMNPGLWGL